jgi:tetratricopeptide (TPR) repeat protein
MMKKTLFVLFIFLSSIQGAFSADFYDKMGLLYEKKDFKTIEQECLKEIENSPKSLDAYFFLAAIRLYEAKYDEAKPYVEKFQKYHAEMEDEESRKTGHPVILIDARYTGLYFEIGKSRFMDARYADAIPWLLKAKSSFYKDPMLNFFLGISYKQTKEYDEAIKYFKRQLENAPEEPSPYYNIACVYAEQGKTREAIASLKKAVEAHPEFQEQARNDGDFDKIRNTKEFMALIK